MAKENIAGLNVGELSELVILSVLARLGTASIPVIVKSLATATENGKAPFIIGPSVEHVLRWKETKNEVVEERKGHQVFYRVTELGRNTVNEFRPVVMKFFPRVAHVSPVERPARFLRAANGG